MAPQVRGLCAVLHQPVLVVRQHVRVERDGQRGRRLGGPGVGPDGGGPAPGGRRAPPGRLPGQLARRGGAGHLDGNGESGAAVRGGGQCRLCLGMVDVRNVV